MLSIHRFATKDPVIANVFDGRALNAFACVRNNPLAVVDPSGFEPEKPPILPIAQRITYEPDHH